MAIICSTVTTFVVKDVLNPVEQWVNQQQQSCVALPWWDPRKWLCTIVIVLVKIIVWVVQHILVPIVKTVCIVVSWVVGAILLPFAAAIDAVCETCNCYQRVLACYFTPTAIEYVSSAPSSSQPGLTDYTFKCNCHDPAKSQQIHVTAGNDDEAATLAKEKCAEACK